MIGMSWALFVAGCPTVVVSQWKVDSARTTDLMLEFHRNLLRRKGDKPAMTKAEALRKAALKLLHGPYNHPAYWAGFVLTGKEREVCLYSVMSRKLCSSFLATVERGLDFNSA